MSKILKLYLEILILLGITAILFLSVDRYYAGCETGADQLMKEFRKSEHSAVRLFIGNSHTLALSLAADRLEPGSSVSFAFGGMDLFNSYALVRKYLDSVPCLRYVYIGIDEEWLGYNQTESKTEYVNRSLYRYTDTLYNHSLSNRLLASSNFFRSNRNLDFLFAPGRSKVNLQKMVNGIWYPPDDTIECRQRAIEHSSLRFNPSLVSENLHLLKSICEIVRARGIRLCLFYSPKRSCYMKYRDKKLMNPVEVRLETFILENQIPYIRNVDVAAVPDILFSDPDHLTPEGAAWFLGKLIPGNEKVKTELQ